MENFTLIKFFRYKSFADDFLEGKLYANRLSCFRKMEKAQGGDPDEGAIEFPTDNARIEFRDSITGEIANVIESEEFVGPISLRPNWVNFLNVFCMHKAGVTNNDLGASIRIDSGLPKRFGEHVVVITNVKEFFARVDKVATAKTQEYRRGPVIYDEPASFEELHSIRAALYKKPEFSGEREYRFVFSIDMDNGNANCLEIGDIKDIAVMV